MELSNPAQTQSPWNPVSAKDTACFGGVKTVIEDLGLHKLGVKNGVGSVMMVTNPCGVFADFAENYGKKSCQ